VISVVKKREISLRPAHWWNWEDNHPLKLDSPVPELYVWYFPDCVETFILQLESTKLKKAELNATVKQIVGDDGKTKLIVLLLSDGFPCIRLSFTHVPSYSVCIWAPAYIWSRNSSWRTWAFSSCSRRSRRILKPNQGYFETCQL
jgi:hypothetical protein